MKLHILQILAYLVIITAGIKAAASIISIILLAALFAVSLMPIVIWLMQKGLSKSATLSIIIVFIIIATLLMGSVLSVAFIGMAEKAPQYEEKFMLLISEVYQLLGKFGIDLTDTFSLQGMEGQKMMAFATAFFESIVSVFSDFTIVFLLIIFLIIDLTDLRFRIQRGERSTSKGLMNLYDLAVDIRKYVSISAFTGFLTALGNFILLIIIGVDFPFLWAFLSFLFSFIPNIGFILSVIPPALLALFESGWTEAIIVIAGFIIINGIVENVIKPKYMGDELNLSLFVIFVSLIYWTWILGGIGSILAIPLTISAIKAWKILIAPQPG